ncbi:divisome protein SepX/GlpR, partial [Streptomyces hydrogenans]
MSSSGLIYAVIVGAWAAYLVPMWLRRQDELNEARPTERFSTAIRLLSGRAGMERRYAKELRERDLASPEAATDVDPDAATEQLSSVDVRAFSAPPARTEARLELPEPEPEPAPEAAPAPRSAAERARRGKALARRRRTTIVLFSAFTLGAVVAAVGGIAFLWAPGVPAVLLSAYIVHLRGQERRRFVYVMDRRRAEAAAARLRESRRAAAPTPEPEPSPAHPVSPQEADRRALVEQTD